MIEDLNTQSVKEVDLQCLSTDISNLPLDVAAGSQCLVIDTGDVYMFASGAWKRLGG